MVPAILMVQAIFMVPAFLPFFTPPVFLRAFYLLISGFILFVLCRFSSTAVSGFVLGFRAWLFSLFVFGFGFNIRGNNCLLIQDLIDQVLFLKSFNPFDF